MDAPGSEQNVPPHGLPLLRAKAEMFNSLVIEFKQLLKKPKNLEGDPFAGPWKYSSVNAAGLHHRIHRIQRVLRFALQDQGPQDGVKTESSSFS